MSTPDQDYNRVNLDSWNYAANFIQENAAKLGKMSIREAVEVAYKAGHNEAMRKQTEPTHGSRS